MNFNITNQRFLVGGATSGFGRAITGALVAEGARVTAVARKPEALEALKRLSPDLIDIFSGDLTRPETLDELFRMPGHDEFQGALINAGGPPAKSFLETMLSDWDEAYRTLVRWKVDITQRLAHMMVKQHYGRLLFIESVSVKQPIENLVLSNSLRMAVVGFVKTFSAEISRQGITMNIMAPGYHDTPALSRLYKKRSESEGITEEEARQELIKAIPVGILGRPEDFASLAVWLLSPQSAFITGQTISVDGGNVKGVFG